MKLPFFLSDEDWQKLKPKEIDQLGRKRFRDPDQAKQIEVFHVIDLRVEWACQRLVILNNVLVVVGFLLLAINGTQILNILLYWVK